MCIRIMCTNCSDGWGIKHKIPSAVVEKKITILLNLISDENVAVFSSYQRVGYRDLENSAPILISFNFILFLPALYFDNTQPMSFPVLLSCKKLNSVSKSLYKPSISCSVLKVGLPPGINSEGVQHKFNMRVTLG